MARWQFQSIIHTSHLGDWSGRHRSMVQAKHPHLHLQGAKSQSRLIPRWNWSKLRKKNWGAVQSSLETTGGPKHTSYAHLAFEECRMSKPLLWLKKLTKNVLITLITTSRNTCIWIEGMPIIICDDMALNERAHKFSTVAAQKLYKLPRDPRAPHNPRCVPS